MAVEETPWREVLIEIRQRARPGTAWKRILGWDDLNKQGHRV